MKTKAMKIHQRQTILMEEMFYTEEDGWLATGRMLWCKDSRWHTTDDIDYQELREYADERWGKGWLAIRFRLVEIGPTLPQGLFWSQDETDQYRFYDWETAE